MTNNMAKDIDEFIKCFSKENIDITMCRYALDDNLLLAIIREEENFIKLPIHFIYEKDNYLIIYTDKMEREKNICESLKQVNLMIKLVKKISETKFNNYSIGSPESCCCNSKNDVIYFEWSLSKDILKKQSKELKKQLIKN